MVNTHTIRNVSEFLANLPKRDKYITRTVFRGHKSTNFELIPSLFRRKSIPATLLTISDLEERLLQQFQAQAIPHLKTIPQDILGWIVVAQHHGLHTRLLDWTESPLTALFFAVDDPQKDCLTNDGVVWCLTNYIFRPQIFTSVEHLNEVINQNPHRIYFPDHTTPRISAQQGCFTIHIPALPGKFISLEQELADANNLPVPILDKFVIPSDTKPDIRQELNRMGIHYFSIFPDLDGLCRRLVWEIDNYDGTMRPA